MVDQNKAKQQISDTWPIFSYGHVVIARWTHPEGKHRVYLIERSDGLFSYSGERFLDDPTEMCWTPDNVHTGLYDSEQIAIREILATYPWSCNVPREERPVDK
jgi:hypothetical protein